jgi:outer membrane protein assembly factor BamB
MRRSIGRFLVAAGLLGVSCPLGLCAENSPAWRGPGNNAVIADEGYPVQWSDQNILWKVDMASHSGSTPVVWGDQIILTLAVDGQNVVQAYDWQGQLKWQAEVGAARDGKNRKATGTNPSPVTDGKHVYVYFKSGDLACLDLQGQSVWHVNLQRDHAPDELLWDLGTSPVLTDEHLVVAVMQEGPSYMIALDKMTGDVAWKVDRMVDAPGESNDAYTTPLVIEHNGKQLLVALGADHLTAHDAADGKELWKVGGFNPQSAGNYRSIASPVFADGVIVAPYARGNSLTAVSLEGQVLWRNEGRDTSADVPTPVIADGKVYVCSDKGRVACTDLKTGEELWHVETGRQRNAFSASPVLVNDRLYMAREDGRVFVVSTTGDHRILATNEVDGLVIATPVFLRGKILIRTSDHLYCIGSRGA